MAMHYQFQSGATVWFDDVPPPRAREILRGHGFRWEPLRKVWWRRRVTGTADILLAIDKVIEPKRPDGLCWNCRNPEGYHRNRGAASPVLCDACAQATEGVRA